MKCPYCGNECEEGAQYCDVCRQPLPDQLIADEQKINNRRPKTRLQKVLTIICWILVLLAIGIGVYKLVFWIDSYKINKLYTRGAYTPTLSEIVMDDGQLGHALVFYGKDGDMIYLPELGKSLSICGGVARLELADSSWFGNNVSEYDYANITFMPILIRENGKEIQLPEYNYQIEVPESPITVTNPAAEVPTVVTSVYPLDMKVVPGSSVFINGEDLTKTVDRGGSLSVKVAVQPIGNNTYTVIVRTPHHKETRRDIVIYREKYDINIELDSNVSTKTNSETMTISGTCEPGAMISIDTDFVENSYQMDMTTGRFSFMVQFKQWGDNVIRFRATMEGREDAVISFTVNYFPNLAVYSAKAWKMDYDELRKLFEQWTGKVFLCKGAIIDHFSDDGVDYLVMDVGTADNPQLIVLENQTSIASPAIGPRYSAYADVSGRRMYNSKYYPMLIARYMDLADQ